LDLNELNKKKPVVRNRFNYLILSIK